MKLDSAKRALLFEVLPGKDRGNIDALANTLKNLPITVNATTPMNEAISTAGGVQTSAVNDKLMFRNKAGVFCAGEMLDWDAPTGGYLLTACLALGKQAGLGAADWLRESS